MTNKQTHRLLGQTDIVASATRRIELPKNHWLGSLQLHGALAVTDSSAAAITVVDTTLGGIPLVKRAQLILDGRTIPLNISGRFLDYWNHIDKPGAERLALSSTTSGAAWDFVLNFEVAQAVANLTGAIPLWKYASAVLEIEFDTVASIASSANTTTISGTMNVYGELYLQNRPLVVDDSVVHALSSFQVALTTTGERSIDLPEGRILQRVMLVAENNSAFTWDLLNSIMFRAGTGDEPYKLTTPMFRHHQNERYGGDDVPITGIYVFDLRRAGSRDLLPLGDPEIAPNPELVVDVSTVPSLVDAKVHVILEELVPIRSASAAAA